jgi:hypothetical protein
MKRTLYLLTFILASLGAFSQTAVNFTCNDCAGVNHDLFTELDAGNVVVLCWVMPCSSCIPATLTSYNVVQSFALTYPGRVHLYIVDDYGNTNCTSLTSWANGNGFTNAVKFSNSSIKMSDYGSIGMPKVVVVGNDTHHVYYNANNTVNATLLSNAITTALQDFSVGISEPASAGISMLKSYPNPADDQVTFTFSAEKKGSYSVTICDFLGKQSAKSESFVFEPGEHSVTVPTAALENGLYFGRIQSETGVKTTKFIISR